MPDSTTIVTQENKNVKKKSNKIWNTLFEHLKLPLTIAVPNYLVQYTGNGNKALFLAQIIYWSDHVKRFDGYFYKDKKAWVRELGLTVRSLERFEQEFVDAGFLQIKLSKANKYPTVHYKLDLDKLTLAIYTTLQSKGIISKSV